MSYVLIKPLKINLVLGKSAYCNKRSARFQYFTGSLLPSLSLRHLLWITTNLICMLSDPVYQYIGVLSRFFRLCLHVIAHFRDHNGSSGSCHDK